MPSVNIARSAGYGRRGPNDTAGGSVFAPEWSALLPNAGGRDYGVIDQDSWKVTRGALDREIVIAPGRGYGKGILDTTEAVSRFQLPAPSSGSVWHLIVAHRDWAARQSSFKNIAGNATAQLPARETVAGLLDDQPIALVRVQAGQSQVAEVRDLRVWGRDISVALDDLVLQYLDAVGTAIRIGPVTWTRTLNGLGTPTWVSAGDNAVPAAFAGRFARSDGQPVMNTGQTLMRWNSIELNTLGGTAAPGAQGATYTLGPGLYLVTVEVKLDADANYSSIGLPTTGATVLASTGAEMQTPSGFYALSTLRVLHVADSATVAVFLQSNISGRMREDGALRIVRLGA